MAKQFTNAPKRPPLQGAKFGIPSPILESYAASKETTMGQVVSFTATAADQLDRCEVYFMGKIIRATCCHPGISEGMNVNMIEQPRGIWWATVMQKSWYSRPLLQLIQKGHGYQAAVEYLLSFGAKWRPRLIIIDKRGTSVEPPYIPPFFPNPWELPINPETGNPYTFDDLDIRGGPGDTGDGYLTLNEWPYDAYLFGKADTNHDGKISPEEWAAFLLVFPSHDPKDTVWPKLVRVSSAAIDFGTEPGGKTPAELIAEAMAELNAYIAVWLARKYVYYYVSGGIVGWLPLDTVEVTTIVRPGYDWAVIADVVLNAPDPSMPTGAPTYVNSHDYF